MIPSKELGLLNKIRAVTVRRITPVTRNCARFPPWRATRWWRARRVSAEHRGAVALSIAPGAMHMNVDAGCGCRCCLCCCYLRANAAAADPQIKHINGAFERQCTVRQSARASVYGASGRQSGVILVRQCLISVHQGVICVRQGVILVR